MYAEFLDFAGMRAETAENGRVAVRRALRSHPAAIVMDLAMPVMNGWEATQILHTDPRTKDIPIVVLTGQAEPKLQEKAKAYGAAYVLSKPCTPRELLDVLRQVIDEAPKSSSFRR